MSREAFEKQFMPARCHWNGSRYAPDDNYDPDSYRESEKFNFGLKAWQAALESQLEAMLTAPQEQPK